MPSPQNQRGLSCQRPAQKSPEGSDPGPGRYQNRIRPCTPRRENSIRPLELNLIARHPRKQPRRKLAARHQIRAQSKSPAIRRRRDRIRPRNLAAIQSRRQRQKLTRHKNAIPVDRLKFKMARRRTQLPPPDQSCSHRIASLARSTSIFPSPGCPSSGGVTRIATPVSARSCSTIFGKSRCR